MINIVKFYPKTAVCPFCRKYIHVDTPVYKSIIAHRDTEALKSILRQTANRIKCSLCGEEFYYEHNCGIINTDKNYAIAALPNMQKPLPEIKTALFKILGKQNFRLRYVHEFIYLTEKARIFEFDLDDRVLEIIKYKYIAETRGLGTDAKIILINTNSNALIFGIYDDCDKLLTTHCVGIDSYAAISASLDKELADDALLNWKKIDLNWAKEYTKENIK